MPLLSEGESKSGRNPAWAALVVLTLLLGLFGASLVKPIVLAGDTWNIFLGLDTSRLSLSPVGFSSSESGGPSTTWGCIFNTGERVYRAEFTLVRKYSSGIGGPENR